MAKYKISLLGLYQYSNTLFSQLQLPAFQVQILPAPQLTWVPDKDTLIATILEKAADFPCLYPNFDFMQFMIGVWSKNCAYMMNELWLTTVTNYKIAENFDRTTTITRTTSSSGSGSTTDASTAFNADTFKDTHKSSTMAMDSGSESVSDYAHGNIGIRSAQELILQDREVALFKWYDVVSDDFIHKFCIELY